jgi:hypothetical protein
MRLRLLYDEVHCILFARNTVERVTTDTLCVNILNLLSSESRAVTLSSKAALIIQTSSPNFLEMERKHSPLEHSKNDKDASHCQYSIMIHDWLDKHTTARTHSTLLLHTANYFWLQLFGQFLTKHVGG